MDNSPFFVSPYPSRPRSPWKLEIRAGFAGKKIRRFFPTQENAFAEGERLTGQIRERGTHSLAADGLSVSATLKRFWAVRGPTIKGRHRETAISVLGLFTGECGRIGIKAVGPADLVRFWTRDNWPEGKSARWQGFTYLRIFFNWCERWDLVDRNPIRRVDPPAKPKPLTGIVAPEEMRTLLDIDPPHLLAFVCLGGFAGLRSSEILRIDAKKDLDWRAKEIWVSAAGKTGGRYVRMLPAFIRHCPRKFAFPSVRHFYTGFRKAVAGLGLTLPQNALRHSWHTYHLAKSKNAALTASEGGNSEKMVKEVYALPAKRAKQAAYWRL